MSLQPVIRDESNSKPYWLDFEVELLYKYSSLLTAVDMAPIFGKSKKSLNHKISRLGLSTPKRTFSTVLLFQLDKEYREAYLTHTARTMSVCRDSFHKGPREAPLEYFRYSKSKIDSSCCRSCYNRKATCRTFSIDGADYYWLIYRQKDLCAICFNRERKVTSFGDLVSLSIDHDHKHCTTGCKLCIRGMLCFTCNAVIIGRLEKYGVADLYFSEYLQQRPFLSTEFVEWKTNVSS
jgi:hypothetical protein